MNQEKVRYRPEQLRAVIYQKKPEILNGLRYTLAELLSIARTYAPLQKYDVTQHALNAIGQLLAGYLRLRDGDLIMPTSMQALVGPTDFQFDAVLTEGLEGLTSLHRSGIVRGDVQLSQQIIEVLENLCIQSMSTRTLSTPPDENPTAAFIRGFMFGPVQDGALKDLDDIAMSGARALSNIGQELLRRRVYLTGVTTIDDIEKLAYIGIFKRKSPVTGTAVRGITEMLQVAVSTPATGHHGIQAGLSALRRICEAELQFKTTPMDQSLRFSIGAFLDPSEPSALANLEALAIQKLSDAIKEGDSTKIAGYRGAIEALNTDLSQHLVGIGTAAAGTESFALFYINANIREIAHHGLWLYGLLTRTKEQPRDSAVAHEQWIMERFAEKLLNDLHWIVGATYWRIFEALKPPIRTNLIWDFFPTLSEIGIRALDAGVPRLAKSAISELQTIASKCIDKPIQSFRSGARVAVFIARIGIVAQNLGQKEIADLSIKALREFNQRYFAKQQEIEPRAESYEATLLNEIQDLSEDLQRGQWSPDEEDFAFFSRVTPEDIQRYLDRLSASD